MELTTHPLLTLVESNANGLKLLLKNYIDFTVDNQFDQLKNSIVELIATGQIGPQNNDSASAYTQTTFTSGQSIADFENLPIFHPSNDQLIATIDQITSSCSSPVSTISTQIKEECLEDSSSTIPINVQCNDAPNDPHHDEDKEQSNNVDIEVNHAQNGQVPIDEVKEEYDEYDEDEGEDCVKGICQLNQSHNGISSSVQGQESQDEFVEVNIDDDQLLPTRQQHNDHSTASIVSSTMYHSNDQLTTDQITLPPTNQPQTKKQSILTNHTVNEDEEIDFEDYFNEITEEDEEDGVDEIDGQFYIDQDDEESSPLDEMQRSDTTQPLKGQCPIETTQVNSQIECDEPVDQHSIPSTSGLRTSGRKRIQRKMCDAVQLTDEMEGFKRKSMTQSSKTVKKGKHQEVDEIQREEGEDDEVSNEVRQEETKLQVVTLEMNCTEPDCETILKSLEMWKGHLLDCHDQMPYKQLRDNARHNNRGQTDYPCTKCNVVCKSPNAIFKHWKYSHQPGKFECSVCAFEANFQCEVHSHMQKSHRPRKFPCTFVGCNKVLKSKQALEEHQRIHRPQRAYACIWNKCQLTFKQHRNAIKHVRVQHFRLPITIQKQHELNIIDERDPRVFVKVSGD